MCELYSFCEYNASLFLRCGAIKYEASPVLRIYRAPPRFGNDAIGRLLPHMCWGKRRITRTAAKDKMRIECFAASC